VGVAVKGTVWVLEKLSVAPMAVEPSTEEVVLPLDDVVATFLLCCDTPTATPTTMATNTLTTTTMMAIPFLVRQKGKRVKDLAEVA